MNRTVYSFDVFDTCLARLCGDPINLFDVLSKKVVNAMGGQDGDTMSDFFVTARLRANGKGLAEIYSEMGKVFPLPYSVEEMVQLELETESEMLVPIAETKDLLNKVRCKGGVVFISDMYLPASFIQKQLTKHGFFCKGDQLFVSNDVGASKRDGSLYRFIHDQERIPYRSWHHYGDNIQVDFRIPKKLGIHAHLIRRKDLPYERKWKGHPVFHFPFPSIMAGISRAVYGLSCAPEDLKSFVCDVSAPLMVSWVVFVLDDALKQGISDLFFCARDTHSFYNIARTLIRKEKKYKRLTAHYLFVSTNALDDGLLLDFFLQEGLASKEKNIGVVDIRGRGYFIDRINEKLKEGGFCAVRAYVIQICSCDDNRQMQMLANNKIGILHNVLYSSVRKNRVNAIENVGWLLENLLSVNYHQKTIGYYKVENRILPVFSNAYPEVSANDIRSLKRYQDNILSEYAKAFVICGLVRWNNSVFSQLVIPTFVEFANEPRKEYLGYLTRFRIYGKKNSYVHKAWIGLRTKGGHWFNGCLFYSFPRTIASFVNAAYKKIKK